jgi:ETC complex I subunit conserved region
MKVVDARHSTAPVAETTAPITRSLFPVDAQAVIYKAARSTMMSAPKRKDEWKLRFERRTALLIEPLMGWTEDDDPLARWNCRSARRRRRSPTLAVRDCNTLWLVRHRTIHRVGRSQTRMRPYANRLATRTLGAENSNGWKERCNRI